MREIKPDELIYVSGGQRTNTVPDPGGKDDLPNGGDIPFPLSGPIPMNGEPLR